MKKHESLQLIEPDIIPRIEGIASPYLLYRYDKLDDRYYFTFDKSGESEGFISVTTFVGKSLGISNILMEWTAKMGLEEARAFAQMRADYGTILHTEVVDILRKGKGDFDDIRKRTMETALSLGYKHMALIWIEDIMKDIAAFLAFVKEYQVEVVSAEFPIASRKWKVAGCIDLVVTLMFNKKRRGAIVDVKSGRKGFFREHQAQLEVYKLLWNEHYESVFPITHVFNWAPNNWKSKPTYKLKNQTKNEFVTSMIGRLQIGLDEGFCKPPLGHMELVGKFELSDYKFEDHVKFNKF